MSAGHYLTNVSCDNCEKDALFKLEDPKAMWRGWFGGCGDFDCTGLENLLIRDNTGTFLGKAGATTISMNEDIGDHMLDTCSVNTLWNGY